MAKLDFTPDRIIAEIAKVAAVNTADFVTIDEQGQPHIDFSTQWPGASVLFGRRCLNGLFIADVVLRSL